MRLISFLGDAGVRLVMPVNVGASTPDDIYRFERQFEQALVEAMEACGLPVAGVVVAFDAATATVTLAGAVADQPMREKITLCCGNVLGIRQVIDLLDMPLSMQTPPSQFYTVQSGDTLSTIALRLYGDAGQYRRIFDANQPMLSDPQRIYPGLMLRIPA